jgi:protoporphyrinogen oxidase
MKEVVVIGAGLSGLGAAYCLSEKGVDFLLIEREAEVGGLCRSMGVKGFKFDYSGHLLCFRDQDNKRWIESILDDELVEHKRIASIYLKGRQVPYPIQANLGALPRPIMKRCLGDYLLQRFQGSHQGPPSNLASWTLRTFGREMCSQFFFPYHKKVWGIPPEEFLPQETQWSIPTPSLTEVVNGALGHKNSKLGYNPTFYYPRRGAIEEVARALERRIDRCIMRGLEVREIHWRRRILVLKGGERISFEHLISTIPLPSLLRLLVPPPNWAKAVARRLRWVSIWVINLGVKGECALQDHWVYFPEPKYPFFRVGSYSSFAPHLSPQGHHSLYVEMRAPNGKSSWGSPQDGIKTVVNSLLQCGIIKSPWDVEVARAVRIPFAYVVHDLERARLLPWVRLWLEGNAIHLAGRYGSWGYGTMEDALVEGREVAMGLWS